MSRPDDRTYRKVINAWSMYDWANSAFYTTIVAGLFPPFYRSLAKAAGFSDANATAVFAYTSSIALVLVAVLGPFLGAAADHSGTRKWNIAVFTGIGVVSSGLMVFLGSDWYLTASALFIVGMVGVNGANIFYEALLPHIAQRGDIDQISTRGYALGYLGGGVLLLLNVLWINYPQTFAIPDVGTAIRLSFLSVAVWWALFSIPLFRHVPEPAATRMAGEAKSTLRSTFTRMGHTFRQIRQYRQLLIFLAAFWLYNDGIGTIMRMATAYGDEIGIPMSVLVGALLITQFVGIPCAFLFGWIAPKVGTKNAIIFGLAVYALISVAAYWMQTATHFLLLAVGVGIVQGGTQALSRSLFGLMVPKTQSAEFFGFFSTSSKFAGIMGPLLFGLISQLTGGSRLSILSLVFFFIVGGALLKFVDVDEGIRVARNEDREVKRDALLA